MAHFVERIKALLPHMPSQQELDQAYLSESVDRADVERRLREIDHRANAVHVRSLGGAFQA